MSEDDAGAPPPLEVTEEQAGPFQPAKDPAKLLAAARSAFDKLGDTPFRLAGLELLNPAGCFIPVSVLNDVRRRLCVRLAAAVQQATAARLARLQAEVQADAPPAAPALAAPDLRWQLRVDHPAVLETCRFLEKEGFRVTTLPVDGEGLVDPADLAAAITEKTILISIMHANNEIGTIQPIAEIGKLAKERGIVFHTDATQAAGKVPVNVEAMGIDLLSATAHLMYGPKGVGCLYVRRKNPRVRIAPMMDGGGHERGMRSGTVPVPLVVGFGKAAEICREVMAEEGMRLGALRDRLQDLILSKVDEAYVNGPPQLRLPHNLNISFAYVEGESVLMGLNKDSALSSGSACTSSTLEPSYVISALGVDSELAHSSIRFGLHRFSTEEEVDYVGRRAVEVVHRLREMSPLYELAKEGVDLKTIQWKGE
jgi:cysteine desulfurase